jgi:hypothetical protein
VTGQDQFTQALLRLDRLRAGFFGSFYVLNWEGYGGHG